MVGLVIGLASVFVISAWTIQDLQYDRFHDQAGTIYMMITDIKDNNGNVGTVPETPPPLADELKEKIPEFENSCHFIYLYFVAYHLNSKLPNMEGCSEESC